MIAYDKNESTINFLCIVEIDCNQNSIEIHLQ